MKPKRVKVYAPATIANLCAGFDVLGIALETPGDSVMATRTANKEFRFSVETTFLNIPISIEDNVAAYVSSKMMDELKLPFGIEMVLHKSMPVGSGLGSSGASSVAAAVAVNALLDKPLTKKELLHFAIEGERKASGTAHVDNVAPSLFGGACIVLNEKSLDVVSFPVHNDITWIVIHPHTTIATSDARRILPTTVPLSDVTCQMGNVSGLVLGLIQGDAELIHKCMVDHIAEPVRQSFIPGFIEMKQAAMASGAIGCGISGSGPSVFAVTLARDKAERIAKQMIFALAKAEGIKADIYISQTNCQGAIVTESKDEV